MSALLCLVLSMLANLEEITAVSYDVTASTGSHLDDVIGCYQDSGHTTTVHHRKSRIFKKDCPYRYLLHLENGNWAIAEDVLGKNVILEQERSSYPTTPDTV